MTKNKRATVIGGGLLLALLGAGGAILFRGHLQRQAEAQRQERVARLARVGIDSDGRSAFTALPPFVPHLPAQAALGGALFRDPRLLAPTRRTCLTCHPLNAGGTDCRAHGGLLTRSVCNAAFAEVFLKDGSCTNLSDCVRRMIGGRHFGGGTNLAYSAAWINSDMRFAYRYKKTFPEGVTPSNVVACLTEYLKTCVTPPGPFDRFANGQSDALSDDERKGSVLFRTRGCIACHDGPVLGGWTVSDGRKVPALRGLAARTRFLADGSRDDLSAVLAFMPGGDLEETTERLALIAFLKKL